MAGVERKGESSLAPRELPNEEKPGFWRESRVQPAESDSPNGPLSKREIVAVAFAILLFVLLVVYIVSVGATVPQNE